MSLQIDGIMPIIPTPFDENERIAWNSLEGLIDFAVAAGACAVCLPAYASEFYKLSEHERLELIAAAVGRAGGRIPVIAQVNSASLRLAREWSAEAVRLGASAICSAAPRLVPLPESDIEAWFDALLPHVSVPFIIQDFNPGGAPMSTGTLARLHGRHSNFQYVKLEDALMARRVRALREATSGGLGVLLGWGGMYTVELTSAGMSGVVPGLALTDVLGRVFALCREGKRELAAPLFEGVLPQIVYSLQSLELFHHAEKRLLRARGVLDSTVVRTAQLRLSPDEEEYLDYLNRRVLALLDTHGMPHDPRP